MLRTEKVFVAVSAIVCIGVFLVISKYETEGDYEECAGISPNQTNNGTSTYKTMERRKLQVKMGCQHHTEYPSRLGYFFPYNPKRIAYCEVPKVACTFWKRIIVFLNKDYSSKISSPAEIPRSFAHFGPWKNTIDVHLRNDHIDQKQLSKLANVKKFIMFTRDPYSRIWSAYLDKIVLPDFWLQIGVPAVKNQRKNATAHSLACGDDVTFQEFLLHILPEAKQLRSDPHFAPIYSVCNPCALNFTYIGKLETFKDDVRYILEDNCLNDLLQKNLFNVANTAVTEIKWLSEDYLGIRKLDKKPQCKNFTLICERLWKVFQMNGYIGFEIPFPSGILRNVKNLNDIKRKFVSHAISEYAHGQASHERWKRQRRQSLVNAYKALPTQLLQQFQSVYEKDFELFGYSKAPADIFL